jgi:hypothetical protein
MAMDSVFLALVSDARREQRLVYRRMLSERDGAVDVQRRTLARREEKMREYLAPITSPCPIDRKLFDAQYARFDRRVDTSPEMLLLLSFVKINAAEAYGVERMIEPLMARLRKEETDLELLLTIEKDYHTRILLSTSRYYDLDITAPYRPRASLRALIGVMASVTPAMSRPIVLAAELMGTLYFLDLLRVARETLRDVPAVRDAVEERLTDVLIDEIGHVSFNRLCLGTAGLAQARMLFPVVLAGLSDAVPELRVVGLKLPPNADRPLRSRSELPDEVRRQAFFA